VCVCNKGVGQTQHTHSNNKQPKKRAMWQPPNPATLNLSNPHKSSTPSDSSRSSPTYSAGTATARSKRSSQRSSTQNKQTQRSGQSSVGSSTQDLLWLFVGQIRSSGTSKRMLYLAGMLVFVPLRILAILSRLLALTIILLPVALVLDTALSAPYLYFKHKLKGWK
jgi:hypothetical protein